jgi:hypothetical protein
VRIEKENNGGGKRLIEEFRLHSSEDSSVLGCVKTTRELPATTTVLWGACNFSGTFGTKALGCEEYLHY